MSTRYGSIAPSRRPLTIRTWPRRQANSVNRWAPTVLQAALPVPLCARWCHLIIAKPYDICSKPALDIMLAELQSRRYEQRSETGLFHNDVLLICSTSICDAPYANEVLHAPVVAVAATLMRQALRVPSSTIFKVGFSA